jgi:hypothetical protein
MSAWAVAGKIENGAAEFCIFKKKTAGGTTFEENFGKWR